MTFEQLQHFVSAAELLSFTKAAEQLYVHQSTVSRSVANLEQELGTALFVRYKKTLCLTPAGEHLYKGGLELCNRIRVLTDEVRSIGTEVVGQLTLTGHNYYLKLLGECYRRFGDTYRNVELKMLGFQEEERRKYPAMIAEGKLDMALLFLDDEELRRDLVSINVYTEHHVIVFSQKHRLAKKERISFQDLQGELGLVTKYIDANGYVRIAQMMRKSGYTPIIIQPSEHRAATESELQIQLESGEGFALFPSRIAEGMWDMTTRELEGLDLPMELYLVYNPNNPNPVLQSFINILNAEIDKYIR